MNVAGELFGLIMLIIGIVFLVINWRHVMGLFTNTGNTLGELNEFHANGNRLLAKGNKSLEQGITMIEDGSLAKAFADGFNSIGKNEDDKSEPKTIGNKPFKGEL